MSGQNTDFKSVTEKSKQKTLTYLWQHAVRVLGPLEALTNFGRNSMADFLYTGCH